MSRLVLFGCSLTYGHGLPDCVTADGNPGPSPSKMVWGELLGDRLARSVVNCSLPGASNQLILDSILNFEFENEDRVVVLWSFFTRGLLYLKDEICNIGPWQQTDIAKRYYELHDDNDLYITSLHAIHYADCYLKNKNITTTHFGLSKSKIGVDNPIAITGKEPKWFTTNVNLLNLPLFYLDMCIDHHYHPGPKSQYKICDYIEKVIINE
jgi:hypothetical protein